MKAIAWGYVNDSARIVAFGGSGRWRVGEVAGQGGGGSARWWVREVVGQRGGGSARWWVSEVVGQRGGRRGQSG